MSDVENDFEGHKKRGANEEAPAELSDDSGADFEGHKKRGANEEAPSEMSDDSGADFEGHRSAARARGTPYDTGTDSFPGASSRTWAREATPSEPASRSGAGPYLSCGELCEHCFQRLEQPKARLLVLRSFEQRSEPGDDRLVALSLVGHRARASRRLQ